MADAIPRTWESVELRYAPRPFVASAMTGLDGDHRCLLEQDLEMIKCAVSIVAERRPVRWDPFYSHEVVPAWEEEATDDAHPDAEVLDVNLSAADRSDVLLEHCFDNGTTMLGHIQRVFLSGPLPKPVLALYRPQGHRISKAWKALAEDHPQLTFMPFTTDSLTQDVVDWLTDQADLIEALARARRAVDLQWEITSKAIAEGFQHASMELRRTVAGRLGLSMTKLEQVIRRPPDLAAIAGAKLTQLIDLFADRLDSVALMDRARAQLNEGELRSWARWAGGKGEQYGRAVLEFEVRRREQVGIFRTDNLLQPSAWDNVARQWQVG